MQVHDPRFLTFLRSIGGWPDAEPLALGMEGAVYRLDNGAVAKLWSQQTIGQLEVLARFYAQLNDTLPGLKAPLILDVMSYGDRLVSIERELPGMPLSSFVVESAPGVSAEAVDATLVVLDALSHVDVPTARELSVLGETSPWIAADDWASAAALLIDRRLRRFGDQLRAAVPDFEAQIAHILDALARLEVSTSVIHGDLVPANILVDADMNPLAVLDFGFLTTAAPPQMDAAIAASIFDMYSPSARAIEAQLDTAVIERFGYAPDELTLYKAVYGLITSNAYDLTGQDGHFEWCARMVERVSV